MEYKLSKYLYTLSKENIILIYSLLRKVIFAITKDKYSLLQTNLSELKNEQPLFFSAMEKLGVIIPCDFDEIDQIKMLNKQVVFSNDAYRLTINPTLECNFNCWYCYEEHPKGHMQQETMDAIVNHIKLKIEDKSLKHLCLDWFGGEPLLYFDEVMHPLGKQIKEILDEKGISISGTATTNGYFINKERISKFKDIGLTNFQITLDGDKETHDKIKFCKNKKGSFQTIIDNINLLCEELDADVAVRVNYTEKTLENINSIIDLFSEKAKNKITVLFQQVWQDSFKKNVCAENNKKTFEKEGIKIKKHNLNNFHVCYADREQQVVVNYNGKIYKCTARDFNEEYALGELLPSGEIQWNIPAISKRFGSYTFENKFCLKCNLLPACMGLCSQKAVELPKKIDKKSFRRMCLQDGVRKLIEQNMEEHYNSIQKEITYD